MLRENNKEGIVAHIAYVHPDHRHLRRVHYTYVIVLSMALIRCPECGSDVSDQAAACPKCGFPVPSRANRLPASEEVRTALKAGNKIEAIKLYRIATNLGLKESKDAVDQIEMDMHLSGMLPPSPPATSASGFLIMVLILLLILAGVAVWMMKH